MSALTEEERRKIIKDLHKEDWADKIYELEKKNEDREGKILSFVFDLEDPSLSKEEVAKEYRRSFGIRTIPGS